MPKNLEKEWRNHLKELRIRSGLHSRKVELSHVKYFHAFVSTLNYVSDVEMGVDWLQNFPPVCQQTIRRESTQDKAVSLPPASRDYSYAMLFAIFLKS